MREFKAARIPKPKIDLNLSRITAGFSGLDLEIGAGQGLHAVRYALTHPTRLIFAVEKTHERFAKLDQRHRGHPELNNLKVLHADAVAFVSHFLEAESLDRVFLLYPNPYPKASQANLRWHNRPFLSELLAKMKPGAQLTVATNLEWYAREAAAAYAGQWKMELGEFSRVDSTQPPRTHFEKKYLERFEACWNLEFRKR